MNESKYGRVYAAKYSSVVRWESDHSMMADCTLNKGNYLEEERAEELAHRWNSHDELVRALQNMVRVFGREPNPNPTAWEVCAVMEAMVIAKKALSTLHERTNDEK